MDTLKKAPYAVIGVGDLAAEKAVGLYGKALRWGRKARRTDLARVYGGLAGRGESLLNRLQRSKPAKRAAEGTRQASRQLKGAVTSIRKAAGMEENGKATKTTRARRTG